MINLTPNQIIVISAREKLEMPISARDDMALAQSFGGWLATTDELRKGKVALNAKNETFLFGAATAPLTGTGIFIGKDGSDYEFRVGDPSGSYLHYDGTDIIIRKGILDRDDFYFFTTFESIDCYGVSGNGTVTLGEGMLTVDSGAGTNYTVLMKRVLGSSAPAELTWDKARRLRTKVYFTSTTSQEIWIILGATDNDRHIGFKVVDDTLYGTIANGSTETTLDCGDVSDIAPMALDMKWTPGVSAEFFVDGVSKGTITTDLPSGTSYALYVLYIYVKTTTTVARTIYLNHWAFWQSS